MRATSLGRGGGGGFGTGWNGDGEAGDVGVEDERLLGVAEGAEGLFLGVGGRHALWAGGDFFASDITGVGHFEGVFAFGDVEEMEGVVFLADFGGDELGVVVGVVDFDFGGVDGASGAAFEDGTGDGVEAGEGDLDVIGFRGFAVGDLDSFGIALAHDIAEVDGELVTSVGGGRAAIAEDVVDDDVIDFKGGLDEVLARGEAAEAEAAGVVGGGSGEGARQEVGAEVRPFASFVFAEQGDCAAGVGGAVVEADDAGDRGAVDEVDFGGGGAVGGDGDGGEERCHEVGDGLGGVVEIVAGELGERGEIAHFFGDDIVLTRADVGDGEGAVEEGLDDGDDGLAFRVSTVGLEGGGGEVDDGLEDNRGHAGG